MQDLGGLGFRGWYKDPGRVLERLSSFFFGWSPKQIREIAWGIVFKAWEIGS